MPLQARLKPYDPAKGHLLRGITVEALRSSYEEGKVYDVTEHDARVLRVVRQRHFDEASPLAFDVLPAEEMAKTVKAETRARLGISAEAMQALREEVEAQPTAVAQTVPAKPSRRRAPQAPA